METQQVSVYDLNAREYTTHREPLNLTECDIDTAKPKTWLRRFAIWLIEWVMLWLGLRAYRTYVTYTHHKLDLVGLDGIRHQIMMIDGRGYQPKYVVVGIEDWRKLAIEARDKMPPDMMTTIANSYTLEVFGVPVVLVPWLSGTFVMPEPEQR